MGFEFNLDFYCDQNPGSRGKKNAPYGALGRVACDINPVSRR